MGIASSGYQRPRGGILGSGTTNSTSYQTVLNVSGSGRLVMIQGYCGDISATSGVIQVTVDGVSFYNTSFAANYNNAVYINNFTIQTATGSTSSNPLFIDINFKKSLKIELKSNSSSVTQYLNFVYELE